MNNISFSTSFDNGPASYDEERFRVLCDNVPGAIYAYCFYPDDTSGFIYLSPAIEKMFGIPVQQFVDSFDHIVSEDLDRLLSANQHSQQTNEPFYFEGRLRTPDGHIKWHSASSLFSYQTQDGCRVFTGIILDISDRKSSRK